MFDTLRSFLLQEVEDRQSCLSGLSASDPGRTGRIACPPLVQKT
jgi:hypothetical protein